MTLYSDPVSVQNSLIGMASDVASLFYKYATLSDKIYNEYYFPGTGRVDCAPEPEVDIPLDEQGYTMNPVNPIIEQYPPPLQCGNAKYRNHSTVHKFMMDTLIRIYARFFLFQLSHFASSMCTSCWGFTVQDAGKRKRMVERKIFELRLILHDAIDLRRVYRVAGIKFQQAGLKLMHINAFFRNLPHPNAPLQCHFCDYNPWRQYVLYYLSVSNITCYYHPLPEIIRVLRGDHDDEYDSDESVGDASDQQNILNEGQPMDMESKPDIPNGHAIPSLLQEEVMEHSSPSSPVETMASAPKTQEELAQCILGTPTVDEEQFAVYPHGVIADELEHKTNDEENMVGAINEYFDDQLKDIDQVG